MKMVFLDSACMAPGLDCQEVPGATPKNPVSGLIAWSLPDLPGQSQAISSPTRVVFQPALRYPSGGVIIARLVFPQELGKAAVR